MKKLFFPILILTAAYFSSYSQVTSEVDVFVRPGTEVHVFEDMTNSNSGEFEVGEGGLLYVDGTLMNNGSMTFNNSASLLRGSNGSDGTGSGTYYVRRQGSNSQAVYNYWSSPMTSYGTVPGSTTYAFNPNNSTLDHGDDGDPDPGWSSYGGSMTPGAGYAGTGAGLYTFSGVVNNGNVNINLVNHPMIVGNTSPGSPFNLVGNPYPSAISAASLVAANTDVNGSIYLWDDDFSSGTDYSYTDYAVWNGTGSLGTGGGTTPPNGFISTGQGFMIRSLVPGAQLNFTNGMRVAGPNTQFFRENSLMNRLWLSVEDEERFNQILIGMFDEATFEEDRLYDAIKLRANTGIAFSAVNEELDYCIMAFPNVIEPYTVPLSLYVEEGGPYTFKAQQMENFLGHNVYFRDIRSLNGDVLMYDGIEIETVLRDGENNDRFYLNFVPQAVDVVSNDNSGSTWFAHVGLNGLVITNSFHNAKEAVVKLIDMSGRVVLTEPSRNYVQGTTIVTLPDLSFGVYNLQILSEGGSYSQKMFFN